MKKFNYQGNMKKISHSLCFNCIFKLFKNEVEKFNSCLFLNGHSHENFRHALCLQTLLFRAGWLALFRCRIGKATPCSASLSTASSWLQANVVFSSSYTNIFLTHKLSVINSDFLLSTVRFLRSDLKYIEEKNCNFVTLYIC